MVPYIDMHCDTLMRAYMNKEKSIWQLPDLMLDIARLKEGGNRAQFFAIFMLPESMKKDLGDAYPKDMDYIKALMEIYHKSIKEHPQVIAEVKTVSDYVRTAKEGKISGILSLEDGRAVDGKFENLEWLYREGIRMIALTWNYENCFGYPNATDAATMQKGLKPFGKEAIACMNDLGIIIDVSHLNDGGFWDIVKLSKQPFVASHSNCRVLSPHQRNLTDEMIRALADKGGVMGLNFYGPFLNADIREQKSGIPQMMQHLKHMVNVGGIDVAAIGTDFDGMQGDFDIPDCSKMRLLFDAMAKEGFTAGQIEKIAYKNVERVMKDIF